MYIPGTLTADQRNKRNARLANQLGTAFLNRIADLERWRQGLAALEPYSCTGKEYWRDRDHPTRSPKLYIIHGIDETCPVHGTPPPGGRLRVYIGSDPAKISEARQFTRNQQRRQELQQRIKKVEYGLAHAGYYLRQMYDALGYRVPEDWETGYVEPRDILDDDN